MTTFQKVIKYCAMAFAVFLTVSIISGILGIVAIFGGFSDSAEVLDEIKGYTFSNNITEIKVEISAADFQIKAGENFSVESNIKNLNVKERNGILTVSDSAKFKLGVNNDTALLIIYIPEDMIFERAEIVTGAGKFTAETLKAQELHLEFGAGEVKIDELEATKNSELNTGAGAVTIKGGKLCNLELDMGVGELNLTSRLLGESDFDYGVGEVDLTLIGKMEDYTLSLDKGIGDIKIDGEKMGNGSVFGNGVNEIDIDGGIGACDIKFIEK